MSFTIKTVNAFEMRRRMCACEVPAANVGYRAFVAVYPPNPERSLERWIVRRFEVSSELVNEYFGQEVLREAELVEVNLMQEAEAVLATWGLDSSRLDAPWKCDYPL